MQHLQPNTTLQGGKYRIEQVLGQGGFGITYLAVQTSLNRYVAIKELFIGGEGQAINDRRGNQVVVTNSANQQSFNRQREKFKKEAMRLANLNHPNLVKVHDFFEENDTVYYVMEYIDGESLRTKLNRDGCLSEKLVLKYMQQLFPALEVAHRQSVWHLDIKPENIMVDKKGQIYLIDFGASKHIEHNSPLTTSLALAYTRGYCPPELAELTYGNQNDFIQALKDIGPWTDIYSLGATMYNLLTDSIPPSPNRLYKEGYNAFIFPNNIETSTHDLIVWMMKPNLEDRPQNVNDIISFLKNKALFELNEQTQNPNSMLDNNESNKQEGSLCDTSNELLLYFNTNNITIDYDIIDISLLDNLCMKYKQKLQYEEKIYVEDISKEINKSIGIILVNLGWLFKEGKVGNLFVKRTMNEISADVAGFSAGDVYQLLAAASSPISLEDIIKGPFTFYSTRMESILLGLGWLMKEGKLLIKNNLISLGEDHDIFNEMDNSSIKSISSEETIISNNSYSPIPFIDNSIIGRMIDSFSNNDRVFENIHQEEERYLNSCDESSYDKAIDGHADAQYEVGILLMKANNIHNNFSLALGWLEQSAEQGYKMAIDAIVGIAIQKAKLRYKGIPHIPSNKDSMYIKAENGDSNAQYYVGLNYLHGIGLPKSTGDAILWFAKASSQGEERAFERLLKFIRNEL